MVYKDVVVWDDLDVKPWWPTGYGAQDMYEVVVEVMDEVSRAVVFRYRRHVAQAVTDVLSGRYRP